MAVSYASASVEEPHRVSKPTHPVIAGFRWMSLLPGQRPRSIEGTHPRRHLARVQVATPVRVPISMRRSRQCIIRRDRSGWERHGLVDSQSAASIRRLRVR